MCVCVPVLVPVRVVQKIEINECVNANHLFDRHGQLIGINKINDGFIIRYKNMG